MTTNALLSSLATIAIGAAVGALRFSSATLAQTPEPSLPQLTQPQTGQPPVNQPRYNSPSGIMLPGQHPSPQLGQPGSPAQAQPMSPAADVLLSFSGTGTQPVHTIAVAPNIEMLTFTLYVTSMNGAANDTFMDAMPGVCSGSAFLHSDANRIEATGFCNYADAERDQVFEHFIIPPQSQDNPLQAQGQWIGGTGKYQGLQGGFVLAGFVLPAINDTVIQLVGQKHGRYTLTQAQVQAPPQGQVPGASGSSSGSSQQPFNPTPGSPFPNAH
jgi:hypothetical protein